MSNDSSMRSRGITKPDFRPRSRCLSLCQAPFYLYARWLISDQPEGTIGRLRYLLGGDRPSQTPRQPRSPRGLIRQTGEDDGAARVVFQRRLRQG